VCRRILIYLLVLGVALPSPVRAADIERSAESGEASSVYVKPAGRDLGLGSVMGLYQTTAAGMVWFNSGVHPGVAAAISLGMGARTWIKAVYLQTFDNLMRFPNRGGKPNAWKEMAARQGENLFFLELWRLMSGPVGKAPSALTLAGQLDIFSFLTLVGTAASFSCAARNKALSPRAKMWMAFNGFLVGAALRAAEQAGLRGPELVDLSFFKLSSILGAVIAYEVVSGALVRKFPDFFEAVAARQERAAATVVGTCRRVFSSLSLRNWPTSL
jgi:hypothetical protein